MFTHFTLHFSERKTFGSFRDTLHQFEEDVSLKKKRVGRTTGEIVFNEKIELSFRHTPYVAYGPRVSSDRRARAHARQLFTFRSVTNDHVQIVAERTSEKSVPSVSPAREEEAPL